MSEHSGSVAVIGIGNLLRGDDGAGILVARTLRGMTVPHNVTVFESNGDVTQLLDCFARFQTVHLVDAVQLESAVSRNEPARIFEYDALREEIPMLEKAASSHVLGISQAIALTRMLGKPPSTLKLWGIEGKSFDLGTEPTPQVLQCVKKVAEILFKDINRHC